MCFGGKTLYSSWFSPCKTTHFAGRSTPLRLISDLEEICREHQEKLQKRIAQEGARHPEDVVFSMAFSVESMVTNH